MERKAQAKEYKSVIPQAQFKKKSSNFASHILEFSINSFIIIILRVW